MLPRLSQLGTLLRDYIQRKREREMRYVTREERISSNGFHCGIARNGSKEEGCNPAVHVYSSFRSLRRCCEFAARRNDRGRYWFHFATRCNIYTHTYARMLFRYPTYVLCPRLASLVRARVHWEVQQRSRGRTVRLYRSLVSRCSLLNLRHARLLVRLHAERRAIEFQVWLIGSAGSGRFSEWLPVIAFVYSREARGI